VRTRRRAPRPPSCDPVYSDDGQEIEYYDNCNDPQGCALHPDHSAAQSSQRRT
jgi:hypothetical protein